MSYIFNATEFCEKLIDIANNYKTLYVMGGIGYRLNSTGKQRAMQNSWNTKAPRPDMINNADEHTWAFDCVCLIKSVLWGWVGDESKVYGGATYTSNDVPDISADGMISICSNVCTDFSNIVKGEAVWMSGHIGVYVGDGKVVECTPKWDNKVQITNLGNINQYKTGNYREWTKHGKLPWIDYKATGKGQSVFDKKKKVVKPIQSTQAEQPTDNATTIWNYLMAKIGNPYGVAGLMGNLQAESGLKPNNLENSREKALGLSDEAYTQAVNNGTYNNFVHDGAGYGLAQWTFYTRKSALLDYCKKNKKSIDDLGCQLDYLMIELTNNYKNVLSTLKIATSVRQASDIVLTKFEQPYNQSESVKVARSNNGQAFYNRFV